jgi:hypothetical protein
MTQPNQDPLTHYLGEELKEPGDIMQDRPGMIGMLTSAFYSGLGGWFMLGNFLVLIATGFLLWSGFRFFTSSALEELVYWGVCLIVSLIIQVAIKQWLWSQMDRASLIRELKRTQRLLLQQSTS